MKFLKRRLKNSLQSRSGFTLVELIVVLVILAILAAFTIPAMLGFVEDAKGKAAIAEAREVYLAAQTIVTENSDDSYNTILNKLPDLLKGDIEIDSSQILITGTKPVFKPGTKQKIGIELEMDENGKFGTKIKSIQYIDKTESYLVTITPGGSAEITKLK